MKKYKLTNRKLQTFRGFQWKVGVPAPKLSGLTGLCSYGWYHYYHNPLLANFLNPAHANIAYPICWEVSATGKHKDDCGLKGGCTKMTLLRKIDLPSVTKNQRIAFAILCAKRVYKDKEFENWADKWLSKQDRSRKFARSVRAKVHFGSAYYAINAAMGNADGYDSVRSAATAVVMAARSGNFSYRKLLSIAKKAMEY